MISAMSHDVENFIIIFLFMVATEVNFNTINLVSWA